MSHFRQFFYAQSMLIYQKKKKKKNGSPISNQITLFNFRSLHWSLIADIIAPTDSSALLCFISGDFHTPARLPFNTWFLSEIMHCNVMLGWANIQCWKVALFAPLFFYVSFQLQHKLDWMLRLMQNSWCNRIFFAYGISAASAKLCFLRIWFKGSHMAMFWRFPNIRGYEDILYWS